MKRKVVVLQNKCSPSICSYQCIRNCPVNNSRKNKLAKEGENWAIKIRNSTNKPIIHDTRCIGEKCGICIHECPINAIRMVSIPESTEDEVPIHQYEQSLFKLYRLPQISYNRVVGFLGENAIGKSTVLEILSGLLKPNTGDLIYPDMKDLSKSLTIPGMVSYLKDIYSGLRKIGYKRQDLRYLLVPNAQRTVEEVLREVDERRQFDFYREYLALSGILSKKLNVLSGGELQRTAIAHTFLQDCQVYLIDEPCTFLDVYQRLKLRELFLKQIAENRAVLVVEHDLAVLDYLTDYICILFGTPHVFGIVSRAIATKKAINSFLNGYLQEENIAIRSKSINFRRSARERILTGKTIPKLSFEKFEKTQGNFTLTVNPALIYQEEVLIILGENGLGKTTFANSLPEILARDTTIGEFEYYNISLKPQILQRSFEGSVDDFLYEKTGRSLRNADDKLHLLQPLGIWKLLDKPVKELSGGELQRTYIGACLGKQADIYVLDESSAFLDCIERLKITSVIRNLAEKKKKPIIAIEHDLQVADALGDRILLFNGTPGIHGWTLGPFGKREGMNEFLKSQDITFRRDAETGRARINKPESRMDREQRTLGEYYYTI